MGVRVSKSFKVAPGVRFRVNAKSTSVSFGGKGMRYTVNSKGRRTATARIPGTPVSLQQVSGTRMSAAQQRAATRQERSVAPVSPKPGLFAPRGEKRLYGILARTDLSTMDYAARCEKIAAKYPHSAAYRGTDTRRAILSDRRPARAIRTLEAVFASGVEIADDEFLRQYSPKKSFLLPAGGGHEIDVPISRELVAMRLVLVHMVARQFDRAEAVAAELRDTPVARELRRQLAATEQNAVSGEQQQWQ